MYKKKGILKFYNETPINPKDIFLKILDIKDKLCPNNEWFHFYLSFIDFNKMNIDFDLKNKDFKTIKPYYIYISFDSKYIRNEINKEILSDFYNFLQVENNDKFYYINRNSYEKNKTHISNKYDFYSTEDGDINYALKIKDKSEELNSNNLLELLKLYLKFSKLQNMSDIKSFKTLFFGNISAKIFNTFLEDLTNQNEIIIEKSSNGAVKNIIINENKVKNKNSIINILNSWKQEGKIKNISGSEKFKQFKQFEFTIYNFKGFDNLNFVFNYKNDNLNLSVNSHSLYNTYTLLEEINNWDKVEKILLEEIHKYLIEIENILGYNFINKNDLYFNSLQGFVLEDIILSDI